MNVFLNPDGGADPAAGSSQEEPKSGEDKKYSDKEVNDIIAGKQDDKVKKLLKDLGIESTGSLKENLAKLKDYEEKHKTAEEKSTEAMKALETRASKSEQERDEALATVEAIRAGVSADRAAKLVKIALAGGYEGETLTEKVKAALEDFPEFRGEAGGPPSVPKAGEKVKRQAPDGNEKVKDAFRKAMGLS